ncbi:MAG: LysM peptidoglycan-binding domain-containing protein, partial [Rectinema sp.]|nr:LysM peptidoglycan-binding domain-containing protein [Rectinema sp.]
YDMAMPESGPVKWETVALDRQIDLRLLASKAEIPMETLSLANAELHYTITPPVEAPLLKVPADKAEQVRAVLSDPSIPMVRYEVYKVVQGDTLTAISRRYGVSISMIAKVNPSLNPDRLKIGQTLMIPVSLQPLQKTTAAPAGQAGDALTYIVKKGDTLYGIARQFGTSAQTIAKLNGMSLDSLLRIGQTLKVPAR